MSSQALVGHERVLDWMRNALARGRLGHTFLFVGPEGIGKRRVAQHIARGLLCKTRPPQALDPCGSCADCLQVNSGAHPDFFEIEKPKDKNILPIELIQDLCKRLALKPARCRYKIAVVDDADLLRAESANCFLKTLEEPPASSLLILLATSSESQLGTIVSRSQLVRFSPLSDQQVAELLIELGITADPQEAKGYARWSGGSVGRAIEFAQPEWNEIRHRLYEGLAEDPLRSVALATDMRNFIDEAGKDAAAKRSRTRQLLRLATEFYRDCLRCQQSEVLSEALHDPRIGSLAERLDSQQLLDLIERCLGADYHIKRYLNQTLIVDCWIDDLAQITAGEYVRQIG